MQHDIFLSFKWQLDTFVFLVQVVAIKTCESITLVHTVRINKQEANLTARSENFS